MNVVRVMHVKVVNNEPVFTIHDDQGNESLLTFADGSAFEVMNGLVRCAHQIRRPDGDAAMNRGPVYQAKDCVTLLTADGQHGIGVRTTEGYDFPIVLNPQMRTKVIACIRQIDTLNPPGGARH